MVDYATSPQSNEGEGHTTFQTPEIDGKTFFTNSFSPGTIFEARVVQLKDSFDVLVS